MERDNWKTTPGAYALTVCACVLLPELGSLRIILKRDCYLHKTHTQTHTKTNLDYAIPNLISKPRLLAPTVII